MKFLGWMQNKFGGKQDIHRNPTNSSTTYHHAKQEAREEFSDWPHGLLAIGTFGNKNEIKHQNPPLDIIKTSTTTTVDQGDDGGDDDDPPSSSSSQENIADFTPEEIGKLQKELTKLLRRKPDVEKEIAELPLDRFLNCPSSLEVDRRISSAVLCSSTTDHSDDRDDDREEDIEKTLSVILGKCKDICADKTKKKKAIGKKSISFLLKKMFVCGSGFAIPPNPRDTLQESRMEKLLRVMLHKKIYSQNTSRVSSMKRCLEDKKMLKKKNEEEEEDDEERTDDGCRWVKTDSEYIVLEI